MKRRLLFIAVIVAMTLSCLCGCSSSAGSAQATITSKWEIIETGLSGKKVTYDVIPVTSIDPHFSCSDGKNFKFSMNGKDHTGTLTGSNGVYTLDLDDSEKNMEAKISGNKMTVTIVGTSAYFIFEAK
ncbi:MAG: hypothetical protein MRZ61_04940 [Oscillospiraceae bacterium]|nr:hypothetical protein [Oscillospiraceae bacterium]